VKISCLFGYDREEDYGRTEREHPDLLITILPATPDDLRPRSTGAAGRARGRTVQPRQCARSRHPLYHWPVIDEVAAAVRKETAACLEPGDRPQATHGADVSVTPGGAQIIQGRRYAQQLDRSFTMADSSFYRLLGGLRTSGDTNPASTRSSLSIGSQA
jgi:hypothetical protein